MKSFFDFIGRTEATLGVRRWNWTFIEGHSFGYYKLKNSKPRKEEQRWIR
ncbi:hypothetical protein M3172_17435 [Mesobacillus subterraneus]|nr:hypothetical protein [Mesobacillus subterraneus]MCM3574981.1 hypothetical protein [Mesobacillus subterraneus]